MGVEYRQQSQLNPHRLGGGGDARGHLGDIVIGRAVRRVVQIVEFGDAGEPAFQHLYERQGRHCLNIIGRHPECKAVHQVTPGPETIRAGPPALCQPRHGALKAVAVQVHHARQGDAVRRAGWRHASLDRADHALPHGDANIPRPAVREQSVPKKHFTFHCTGPAFCSYCIYNHSKPAKGYFMRADCVFTNASLATMAPDRPGLGGVEGGMVAAVAGRIVYAGPVQDFTAPKIVDCGGRWVTPGLIDCHTHLVYGGNLAAWRSSRHG